MASAACRRLCGRVLAHSSSRTSPAALRVSRRSWQQPALLQLWWLHAKGTDHSNTLSESRRWISGYNSSSSIGSNPFCNFAAGGIHFQSSCTASSFGNRFFSSTPAGEQTIVTQEGVTIDLEKAKVVSQTGKEYAIFEPPPFFGKLKPHIVKRRLARMRTYVGSKKNVRHSEWRSNLVCQMVAGLTLEDALLQLAFCPKKMAPVLDQILRDVARTADVRDGLQHSQLEVAECFATKGKVIKRIKIMGKGYAGRMEHRHTHFRVVLREIDFKLRMYQASSLNQKKKWFKRQQHAEEEYRKAQVLREELEELKRQEAEFRRKEELKDSK